MNSDLVIRKKEIENMCWTVNEIKKVFGMLMRVDECHVCSKG